MRKKGQERVTMAKSEKIEIKFSEEQLRKVEERIQEVKREVLREIHASGGFDPGRLSLELLYLLPDDFVKNYQLLFWDALDESAAGTRQGVGDESGKAKGALYQGKGPQARGGGKKYKLSHTVKNERALELKHNIDRELAMLGRAIEIARQGKYKFTGGSKQCGGCKRFVSARDRYCSGCGTKL